MRKSKFKVGDFVKVKGTPSKNENDDRICIISGRIKKITLVPHTNPRQEDLGFVIDILTDDDTKRYFRSGERQMEAPTTMTFREDDLELEVGKNRKQKLDDLGI